jgi:DUF1680 family protein
LAAAALAERVGAAVVSAPLAEFDYGRVRLAPGWAMGQLEATANLLLGLDDDALLKPFRQMAGKAAPGGELLGWYCYRADFNPKGDDDGFAPGHSFGQWVSALSRYHAITGSQAAREKVLRLNRLFAEAVSGDYFEKNRFPAYCYDKLVCGLIDSHQFVGDAEAFSILRQTTAAALPHLPAKAIPRESVWRPGLDASYTWDESYTLPENLFLAYRRGAGASYRDLAERYLMDDGFFDPLARGENVLAGRHAYSHVNAMSSAMQTYLTTGSEKHLRAATNGFAMVAAQSFATGGWGPDELLRAPDSDDLYASLTKTHNSFETPCGGYAHFKLTRSLLRVTRDSRYGDSMERVLYNTLAGVKPIEADGRAFYYSDYNFEGKRVYSSHRWPCCSGTLPQVAADYGISAYFRDEADVYVNLYLPSTLRWTAGGREISLTQDGEYPLDSWVRMRIAAPRPVKLAIWLRIPEWAAGASVAVNGKPLPGPVAAGRFQRVERTWKDGERIELSLPMELRLEAIDARHPETVALMRGPLVLFPIGNGGPELTRKQLLSARQVEESVWLLDAGRSGARFVPFSAVADAAYSTYLRVSG